MGLRGSGLGLWGFGVGEWGCGFLGVRVGDVGFRDQAAWEGCCLPAAVKPILAESSVIPFTPKARA